MAEKHTILGGKVHVYQRAGSPARQCATYLDGKNRRVSTKEKSLAKAKDFAEDWFFQLRHYIWETVEGLHKGECWQPRMLAQNHP